MVQQMRQRPVVQPYSPRLIYFLMMYGILFTSLIKYVNCQTSKILVIAIVDDNIDAGVESMSTINKYILESDIRKQLTTYIYASETIISAAKVRYNTTFTGSLSLTLISYKRSRYIDRSIDRSKVTIDNVTPILESMVDMQLQLKTSSLDDDSIRVISIAYSTASSAFPTAHFLELYDLFETAELSLIPLQLLSKTAKLTSVSDWQDLQVCGYLASSKVAREWIRTLDVTYNEYANREFFGMLEPRPAILEAKIVTKIKVGYLTKKLVCAENTLSCLTPPSDFCRSSKASVQINCGQAKNSSVSSYCIHVGVPNHWKVKLHTSETTMSLASKFNLKKSEGLSSLVPLLEQSTMRFFNTPYADRPAQMCWDSGSDSEDKPTSLLYSKINGTVKSAPLNTQTPSSSNFKYGVYTAGNGAFRELDSDMYSNLSKMYYASRHGYTFHQLITQQFSGYLSYALIGVGPYAKNVASKAIMILDAMYNTDVDWIFWMDADTQLNSEWTHLSLDEWTADVPENKVLISSNFKALHTGVFLVRNNAQGRRLVRDWVAIVMSGEISCHGFDQAAMEVLMLQRLNGSFAYERPYELSCKHQRLGGSGCNNRGDFSCDYKFEKALSNVGFGTKSKKFWGQYSSFSRGCANDYVPEFHITHENSRRPRLHCNFCGRVDRIEAKFWDGPLGGANDVVRNGAINSWFTNHQVLWLFMETWTLPRACKKLSFVPKCNQYARVMNFKTDKKLIAYKHRLFALTDGIALDLVLNQYCELSEELKSIQKSTTYMRDYPALIKVAKSFSKPNWTSLYWSSKGNGRNDICHADSKENCVSGMKWGEVLPRHILAKDYCSSCRAEKNEVFDSTGRRLALECKIGDT